MALPDPSARARCGETALGGECVAPQSAERGSVKRRTGARDTEVGGSPPSAVVHIARCPEHGLHGERTECFVCGGPVEQVAMVLAGVEGDRRYGEHLRKVVDHMRSLPESEQRAERNRQGPRCGETNEPKEGK